MNKVYDIVLNFFNTDDGFYEFYEWDKNDSLTYIEKIPIIRISTKQLKEIMGAIIQVSQSTLTKIYNKTFSSTGMIPYCMLVTDMVRVIALSFNEKGVLVMQSSLLLDEEDAVIDENKDLILEAFSYTILRKKDSFSFITRNERKIQRKLLREINNLYHHHLYSEIHYLYQEICLEVRSREEEYLYLVERVQNYFYLGCESLYKILQLSNENKKES